MVKKVFIDSDVVISSLISSSGAAYFLLNQTSNLKFYISNISQKELTEVTDRLKIDQGKLKSLLRKRFRKVYLKENLAVIKLNYSEYTVDSDDTHIVAGAKESNSRFLISYNTRHFKVDKIKQDFHIAAMTPAIFLQYLRSHKQVLNRVKHNKQRVVIVSQEQPQAGLVSLDDLKKLERLDRQQKYQQSTKSLLTAAKKVHDLLKDEKLPADLSAKHDHYHYEANDD